MTKRQEGSEERTLEHTSLLSRGTSKAKRGTRSPGPRPQRSPSPPRYSAPRPAGTRRAGSQPSETETLPFRDVKGAGTEALPVQHSLGVWLLLP